MTVACWRLDKVHKVVRGKFSEDAQDLSAPLSDYVDRGVVLENLQLNFDMTSALGENSEKYTVSKVAPIFVICNKYWHMNYKSQ